MVKLKQEEKEELNKILKDLKLSRRQFILQCLNNYTENKKGCK